MSATERHDAIARVATVPTFARLPLVGEDGIRRHWGKDAEQLLCVVKTGSSTLVKRFMHELKRHELNARNIGADNIPGEHSDNPETFTYWRCTGCNGADSRPRCGRCGPKASLREVTERNPGDTRVSSQYLVWGHYANLARFVDKLTGDGKPIARWESVGNIQVGTKATGTGPDSRAIQKRIRESVPCPVERAARAAMVRWVAERPDEREEIGGWVREHVPNEEKDARVKLRELNKLHAGNPASPEHGDTERLARAEAVRIFPMVFDTTVETGPDDKTLVMLFELFSAFMVETWDVSGRNYFEHNPAANRNAMDSLRARFDKWQVEQMD